MDYIKIGNLTFIRSAAAENNRLESVNLYREKSLPSDSLAFDTLEADVFTTTLHNELRNITDGTPISIYRKDKQLASFMFDGISRTGANNYRITASSPVSILTKMTHPGGLYTGQTVDTVVSDICRGVPVIVKTVFKDIKLYGWLPYAKPPDSSARDNLVQVLFAIGASLGLDLNGILRVEPLWDGVSGLIEDPDVYEGGSVDYGNIITDVAVTEHQYITGTEEKQLFSGTTQQGDIITFSEPMHNLSASGFSILESGANYAKLSSGSGTLTGKVYIHNTRQVTATVSSGQAKNVKNITDATLISLVNSNAVAKRLADFYRYTETIKTPIVTKNERPGQVVLFNHPYDKTLTKICIQSMDTLISNTMRADTSAVVGYTPPQIENIEYLDYRAELTGSGNFQVPDGVTTISYAMISGAQGGRPGKKGGDSTYENYSFSHTVFESTYQNRGIRWGTGGAGGQGGQGGSGGRILRGDIAVTPGQSLAYSCGVGGRGGVYNNNADVAGSNGTDTTFAGLTTKNGSISANGYTDIITGKVYAKSGIAGIAGGKGAGKKSDETSVNNDNMFLFSPAEGVVDENGTKWTGGVTTTDSTGGVIHDGASATSGNNSLSAGCTATLAGGAAAGANGNDGSTTVPTNYGAYLSGTTVKGLAVAFPGMNGATATLIPKKPDYGQGGRGGYGGGGAGAYTLAGLTIKGSVSADVSLANVSASVGGAGSEGGPGGDGIIILYYRRPKPKTSGGLLTRDKQFFLDRTGRLVVV